MKCDLCGNDRHDSYCEDIRSIYQTKEIKKICSTCLTEANKHLGEMQEFRRKMVKKLDGAQSSFMRRWFRNQKKKST